MTPSPESITVPVRVRSDTSFDVQLAASAKTAWTAMYNPFAPKDSKKISAVYSRFSGAFNGGSVCEKRVGVSMWRVCDTGQNVREESYGPLVHISDIEKCRLDGTSP